MMARCSTCKVIFQLSDNQTHHKNCLIPIYLWHYSQHDLSSNVHATELSSYLAAANSQADNEVALEPFSSFSDVVYVSVTIWFLFLACHLLQTSSLSPTDNDRPWPGVFNFIKRVTMYAPVAREILRKREVFISCGWEILSSRVDVFCSTVESHLSKHIGTGARVFR